MLYSSFVFFCGTTFFLIHDRISLFVFLTVSLIKM